MTVKVVRGLVQTVKPAAIGQVAAKEASGRGLAARVATTNSAATEAAISSVRSTRSTQSTEKVRDSKEARSLAKSVAQDIYMKETEAGDAHSGLSSQSAQGML